MLDHVIEQPDGMRLHVVQVIEVEHFSILIREFVGLFGHHSSSP
jgi:hypothetical protein